jgi:hypothetical protein
VGILEAPFNCLYLYVFMNMGTLHVTTVKIPLKHFDIAVCFTVWVSEQNKIGWIRSRSGKREKCVLNDTVKPGTHYFHVTRAHIKVKFYFQLLPYPFPCVGSHMLISIIW